MPRVRNQGMGEFELAGAALKVEQYVETGCQENDFGSVTINRISGGALRSMSCAGEVSIEKSMSCLGGKLARRHVEVATNDGVEAQYGVLIEDFRDGLSGDLQHGRVFIGLSGGGRVPQHADLIWARLSADQDSSKNFSGKFFR